MRRAAAAALCLILLACTPDRPRLPSGDVVTFTTDDGVELTGELRGDGEPAVVLLHMYPSDRTAWGPFAETLADQGATVLTFDFRGYGDSDGERAIPEIWRDVLAAVGFVRDRGHEEVVLVGASMGGTAALIVAAREDLAGVVTLSAPTSFMGLTVLPEAVELIEEPKLFVAAEGDGFAAGSAQQLYALASAPKRVEVVEGSDHGIELVSAGPVRRVVLDFVEGL
jgi:pimeloyl-ACP methyl ester carboxylesterase